MKKKRKLVEYDINKDLLKQRVIVLPSEISFDTVNKVVKQILFLEAINKEPIKIWINCLGGNIWAGLHLVDVIEWVKYPVITIGSGIVASMSVPILVVGDIRFITENTFIMLHPFSTSERDYLPFVKSSIEHAEELEKIYISILKRKTKIPNHIFEEAQRKEVYINSKEAIKWQIIDGILKRKKSQKKLKK